MEFSELPLPPEVKDAVERHITQQQMSVQSFRHDVQRLFEELDKEHLVTLRHLFNHLCIAEDGRYASYLEGIAATTLHHRFNVCASCGVNHDEELLKQPEPVDEGTQESLFAAQASYTADELYRQFLQRCRDYGCKPTDKINQDDLNKTPVACQNCGKEYVSLEDRMIEPPGAEHCEGCVHKTKWG